MNIALAKAQLDLIAIREAIKPRLVDDSTAVEQNQEPESSSPDDLLTKEEGNFPKIEGVEIAGIPIAIENPEHSTRSGVDKDGTPWQIRMNDHYGYIEGTNGADGSEVDIFVKPGTQPNFNGDVYVIHQVEPTTGNFDEHKVMLGYDSEDEAKDAYLSNYADDWQGFSDIEELSLDEFLDWIDEDDGPEILNDATDDKKHWITTEEGSHLLIGGDGTVLAGAGGKLNGQKLDRVKSKSADVSEHVGKTEAWAKHGVETFGGSESDYLMESSRLARSESAPESGSSKETTNNLTQSQESEKIASQSNPAGNDEGKKMDVEKITRDTNKYVVLQNQDGAKRVLWKDGAPKKLNNGEWGAIIQVERASSKPEVGEFVTVKKRSGETFEAEITKIVGHSNYGTIVETNHKEVAKSESIDDAKGREYLSESEAKENIKEGEIIIEDIKLVDGKFITTYTVIAKPEWLTSAAIERANNSDKWSY